MLAKYGDTDEAARKLIAPDFYIKNYLQSEFDPNAYPVKQEHEMFNEKLMKKLKKANLVSRMMGVRQNSKS